MRRILAVLVALLPFRLKRPVGKLIFGWDIHPSAYVGRSIILVDRLVMGPGATIGPGNIIRNLEELRMGEGAIIAARNRIEAPPLAAEIFTAAPERHSVLVLGKHAAIMTAHEIDCSDRVELEDYAVMAGFRSQILTHSLDMVRDKWATSPVTLGANCAVMSACVILNGTGVPARSVLAAGSVVTTKLTAEQTLYRGNPAEAVRQLPRNMRFFRRDEVDPSQFGRGVVRPTRLPSDETKS